MKTPHSNAAERNNRIGKAVLFSLFPVLLAGLGGFLFPLSKYLDTRVNGKDCAAKVTELTQLHENLGALHRQLAPLEAGYAQVLQLDQQWEMGMPAARGPLKVEIEGSESAMAGKLTAIDPTALDSLGKRAIDAYTALLGARKTIWELRNEVSRGNGNGEVKEALDKCKEEMRDLRRDIRDIATRMETETKELEKLKAKGLFGNQAELNAAIQKKAQALYRFVSELRNL